LRRTGHLGLLSVVGRDPRAVAQRAIELWSGDPTTQTQGDYIQVDWSQQHGSFLSAAAVLKSGGQVIWYNQLGPTLHQWTLPRYLLDDRPTTLQVQLNVGGEAVLNSADVPLAEIGSAPFLRDATCLLNGTLESTCPLTAGDTAATAINGSVTFQLPQSTVPKRLLFRNAMGPALNISVSADGQNFSSVVQSVQPSLFFNYLDVDLSGAPMITALRISPPTETTQWSAAMIELVPGP
jgi:hypothetical protein